MQGFDTEEATYVAATAEALIYILGESYAETWLGTVQLSADYISSLAEILFNRGVGAYELLEYMSAYDTLDDLVSYDIKSGEDEFNLLF